MQTKNFLKFNILLGLAILGCLIENILAHGRMEVPAARNSAWRFGYGTPENYNDNEQNCGGAGVQHSTNGGKCGICGDSYSGARPHETGGKYATGKIVKSYTVGQTIEVKVRLSANHKGYMQFKVCPVTDPSREVTQGCLDNNLLQIVGYGTQYPVKTGENEINLNVQLPQSLGCTRCVFQWKYRAGNNWGTAPDGTSGPGYGPQEEFYNCADIEIKGGSYIPPASSSSSTSKSSLSWSSSSTPTTQSTKLATSSSSSSSGVIIQPFFHCQKIDSSLAAKLPQTKDPNEFNGIPLCLLIGDSSLTCKDCYENCISPYKSCPKQYCYCRWYV